MFEYLHHFHETREVFGRLPRVLHGLEVIDIGGSVVPVHHDDVVVCPGQQQLREILDPRRWRSSRPEPMNDKSCRSGHVKLGMFGQVGVGHQCATGGVVPGVQQQSELQAGSDDGVTEI